MSNNNSLNSDLETFKQHIKECWDEVTEEDLKEFKTLEEQLLKILVEKYNFAKGKAKKQVDVFFAHLNEQKKKPMDYVKKIEDLKNSFFEATDEFLAHASEEVEDFPKYLKKGEERVVKSIKSHPVESLGFIAIAGFLVGSYFTHKLK